MKRIVVILLAIVCGVAFSDGFAKKPTKRQKIEEQAIQDSLALVEQNRERELDLMKKELEALEAKLQNEEEQNRARLENERKATMTEEMVMPCSKEAQSDDEYYGVLGKGNGHSMSLAMIDATQKAQLELIKLVGEELIDYKIDKVCQVYYQDKYGVFNVYVALRYPKVIKDKE